MGKKNNYYYLDELNEADSITEIKDDVVLKGTLSFKKPLKIDGHIKGEIKSKGTILISGKGKVEGNIEADIVFIEGEVIGDVIGYKKVSILKTGKLKGDIKTAKLKIADDVIFEGSCTMIK